MRRALPAMLVAFVLIACGAHVYMTLAMTATREADDHVTLHARIGCETMHSSTPNCLGSGEYCLYATWAWADSAAHVPPIADADVADVPDVSDVALGDVGDADVDDAVADAGDAGTGGTPPTPGIIDSVRVCRTNPLVSDGAEDELTVRSNVVIPTPMAGAPGIVISAKILDPQGGRLNTDYGDLAATIPSP